MKRRHNGRTSDNSQKGDESSLRVQYDFEYFTCKYKLYWKYLHDLYHIIKLNTAAIVDVSTDPHSDEDMEYDCYLEHNYSFVTQETPSNIMALPQKSAIVYGSESPGT